MIIATLLTETLVLKAGPEMLRTTLPEPVLPKPQLLKTTKTW
jgi:hypothetical protein